MNNIELVIKAIKEDPERLVECLKENETIDLDFLDRLGKDPHFDFVSVGCKAARIITLALRRFDSQI